MEVNKLVKAKFVSELEVVDQTMRTAARAATADEDSILSLAVYAHEKSIAVAIMCAQPDLDLGQFTAVMAGLSSIGDVEKMKALHEAALAVKKKGRQ